MQSVFLENIDQAIEYHFIRRHVDNILHEENIKNDLNLKDSENVGIFTLYARGTLLNIQEKVVTLFTLLIYYYIRTAYLELLYTIFQNS